MENQNQLVKFDPVSIEIATKVAAVRAITVGSPETAASMMTAMKELKSVAKAIEAVRVSLVKPHQDYVKKVQAFAKSLEEKYAADENYGRQELINWEKKLQVERDAAAKKLREEAAAAKAEADRLLAEAQAEAETMAMFMPTEAKQTEIVAQVENERVVQEIATSFKDQSKEIDSNRVSNIRRNWTFEITDADLVPREFMMIDEKAIRAAIKNGTRELAGVSIYQDTSIAI